jgi:hypothetical protein
MKKKLELNKLSVKSFVTKENARVQGGAKPTLANCYSNDCDNTITCYTWGCGGCSDRINPCIG